MKSQTHKNTNTHKQNSKHSTSSFQLHDEQTFIHIYNLKGEETNEEKKKSTQQIFDTKNKYYI